ncbi:hypothetical protein KA001_02855 [Patescibacteria group bacterium]|nr:hypothetical protein [Patescibacteria group bacterium]
MFKKKLPNCNVLFKKFLSPWYPLHLRVVLPRPDLFLLPHLNVETLEVVVINQIKEKLNLIREAYNKDFQLINVFEKLNLEVIDSVDTFFKEKEVLNLIKISDPKDINNEYLIAISKFGLALGDLFVETGKFEWVYSEPYFESYVINYKTGYCIPVFDWAVKKFSSYGINDGFRFKFLKAIEFIEEEEIQIAHSGASL